MQTDGIDLGRFRNKASSTVLHHHGAFLVTTASIIAQIFYQEFRTPISTRSHARREIAGTSKAVFQLIDHKRRRRSSWSELLTRRSTRSMLCVLRKSVFASTKCNVNVILVIDREKPGYMTVSLDPGIRIVLKNLTAECAFS